MCKHSGEVPIIVARKRERVRIESETEREIREMYKQ